MNKSKVLDLLKAVEGEAYVRIVNHHGQVKPVTNMTVRMSKDKTPHLEILMHEEQL